MLNHILGVLLMLLAFLNLTGAAGSQYYHERKEAAKAAARAAAPPAPVTVETFDSAEHVGPGAETALLGRVALERLIENPSENAAWILPLYPGDAVIADAVGDALQAPAYLIHETQAFQRDHLAMRDGEAEALVTVAGRLVDPRRYRSALSLAGADEPGSLVLEPFIGGRDAALARDDGPLVTNVIVALASLGVGLYGYIVYRRKDRI